MESVYGNQAYGNSRLTSYVEQRILSAGPLEVVAMLYSKAADEVREARRQLAARDIALRSKAISKACDVITELDASLNMEAGGALAVRLRGLYRYMIVKLLDANRRQSDEHLAEVLGLLATMNESWQTVAKTERSPVEVPSPGWDLAAGSNAVAHSWSL